MHSHCIRNVRKRRYQLYINSFMYFAEIGHFCHIKLRYRLVLHGNITLDSKGLKPHYNHTHARVHTHKHKHTHAHLLRISRLNNNKFISGIHGHWPTVPKTQYIGHMSFYNLKYTIHIYIQ